MKFCDFRYKVISGLCQWPDAERIVERLLKSCPLIKLILFGPGVDFFCIFTEGLTAGDPEVTAHPTDRARPTPHQHHLTAGDHKMILSL